MGGHGALTLYLSSKAKQYRSASAFAPVANPTKCPIGKNAFTGYLQGGVEEARESQYDATELIAKFKDPVHILIDYVYCVFSSAETERANILGRALQIAFISRDNFSPRTFLRRPAKRGTTNFK